MMKIEKHNQHYVQCRYLANFTNMTAKDIRKNMIWCMNKQGESYYGSINDQASDDHYFSIIKDEEVDKYADTEMGKIEDLGMPVINKIVQNVECCLFTGNLNTLLTPQEKDFLIYYMMLHSIRTKKIREIIKELYNNPPDYFIEYTAGNRTFGRYNISQSIARSRFIKKDNIKLNEIKTEHWSFINFMFNKELNRIKEQSYFLVFEKTNEYNFVTSDSPVIFYKSNDVITDYVMPISNKCVMHLTNKFILRNNTNKFNLISKKSVDEYNYLQLSLCNEKVFSLHRQDIREIKEINE